MTTTTSEPTNDVLVPVAEPLFTVAWRQARAGYLFGNRGVMRGAYHPSFTSVHGVVHDARAAPVRPNRVDIETFRGDI